MNISRSELHALRSERRAYAQAILGIREATGLRDVPLEDLPAMVEQLLSELADRQIRRDIEPRELWPGCDEIVGQRLDTAPGYPAGDPEDDEWSPEDTVVPSPAPNMTGTAEPHSPSLSCRNCLRLVEIDGRLTCAEPRSIPWHYATITWPGPGCVWATAGDAVYGGRR